MTCRRHGCSRPSSSALRLAITSSQVTTRAEPTTNKLAKRPWVASKPVEGRDRSSSTECEMTQKSRLAKTRAEKNPIIFETLSRARPGTASFILPGRKTAHQTSPEPITVPKIISKPKRVAPSPKTNAALVKVTSTKALKEPTGFRLLTAARAANKLRLPTLQKTMGLIRNSLFVPRTTRLWDRPRPVKSAVRTQVLRFLTAGVHGTTLGPPT